MCIVFYVVPLPKGGRRFVDLVCTIGDQLRYRYKAKGIPVLSSSKNTLSNCQNYIKKKPQMRLFCCNCVNVINIHPHSRGNLLP